MGEYGAVGAEIKTYGWKPGSTWSTDPLFMKIGSEHYWYHNDHLGTPQMMMSSSGAVVWKARYTSFGKATVDPGSTMVNPLRFYSFVLNNPLNAIDPLGLDIYYENTARVHGLHRRVSVGTGSTRNYGISFGSTGREDSFISASGDPDFGKKGHGIVYEDFTDPSTKIVDKFVTTPEEDLWIKQQMKKEVGKTGKYHWLFNNCREYSRKELLKLVYMVKKRRKEMEEHKNKEGKSGCP